MRLVATLSDDLKAIIQEGRDEIADAVRASVRSAAEALQAELRQQVRTAGLGNGLEKAWRLDVYPKARKTFRPAALVYSKATRIHDAFEAGATIRARGGKWLMIPLEAAKVVGADRSPMRGGRSRGGPIPAKWSNVQRAEDRYGPLRFVPIGNGARALLVADGRVRGDKVGRYKQGRAASIPVFLLIRQTRLPKRLDIAGAARRAEARLYSNLSNLLGR